MQFLGIIRASLVLYLVVSVILISSCNSGNSETESGKGTADGPSAVVVYYGGEIITMEGDSAAYTESVLIKDGKILFVGAKDEAMKQAGPGHQMVDLEGKTLLPGFIDAHGHLYNAGIQALSANLLPPPDGVGKDITSLVSIVNAWKADNARIIGKVGWIIGFGYDDGQLKEKNHPTATDLDKVSRDTPVIFIHQSGHLATVNTIGLAMAGITDTTSDPPGGVIRRIKGSKKPSGTLEETAMFAPLFKIFNRIDSQGGINIVKAGMEAYSKYGYTTAQEGRASPDICETFRNMAAKGELFLDVYAYPDIQMSGKYMKENGIQTGYNNHFRIAGVKLSLDGSPQGKTAWLTKPYKVPPPGADKNYRGYPAIPNAAEAESYVATAFENNWQIITHCNGDAAIDAYIKAVRLAATQYGNNNRRTVMIHAQTVREDQLDSMKVLGIIPSFFSMHTFYWGDWHDQETLGRERAFRISPTQSALQRGMIFTEHHDAPVANPDAIRILSATVNRVSRSGLVIGPDQRVTTYQALKSITHWAAYAAFEENLKGTIEAGKLADFVILDKNPLKIDPMSIGELKVVSTIKEGKTIYAFDN
jgi:predicted amidohydrolase YtcJ